MKFMLMLYADEKAGAALPPAQMARAMQDLTAYQDALTKAGAFVMTSPLARTRDARTLRMRGGEIVRDESADGGYFVSRGGELEVHDGPYAETREQFGGLYVIDVPGMDEAIEWARRCPAAQWGSIEVRAMIAGY